MDDAMNFLLNTIIMFNSTCQEMLEGWEEACKQAVSNTYVPTCTSGMDGKHSAESGHYYGRSLDFRSKDIPFELRQNLKHAAQEILGPNYLVLLEDNHYHVQRQHWTFGKG